MNGKRCFEVVAEDGTKFTVTEYATYRWEKDENGVRRRIENAATQFVTSEGWEILPTDRLSTYRISGRNVTLRELDETKTIKNKADLALP